MHAAITNLLHKIYIPNCVDHLFWPRLMAPMSIVREAPSLSGVTSHWLHGNCIPQIGCHYFWPGLIALPKNTLAISSCLLKPQLVVALFDKPKDKPSEGNSRCYIKAN